MKWPPHSPDDLDVEYCKEQGLTEDVIALLQKIPWTTATCPGSEFTVHFEVESFLINFSNRAGIETGRFTFGEGDDPVMEPHLVALATRDCGLGRIIAIDAQSGVLFFEPKATDYSDPDPNPDETGHAVAYIDDLLREFSSLGQIPANGLILHPWCVQEFLEFDAEVWYAKTKEALSDYGWPDSFRVADFRRDINWPLFKRWSAEAYEARMLEKQRQGAESGMAQLSMDSANESAGGRT
ncbi:hypothetical protein PV11_07656 [Exophiala sideris]|uniref:Uncharacterized protein n=1 Tax=Exophiala sideris TaxID=1016849 RepID=A0A0D1VV75_9EURO|nr:hypothetical protein PV11_07656 [Exophiala sideris]